MGMYYKKESNRYLHKEIDTICTLNNEKQTKYKKNFGANPLNSF